MLRLTGTRASRNYANEVGEDRVEGAGGGALCDVDVWPGVPRVGVYLSSDECDCA